MSNRSASRGRSALGWGGLIAGIVLSSAVSATSALAVGIPQTQDYLSDPCFKDVSARATAAGLSIPDTSLSNACVSDHGNAEAAWAKLVVLWRPKPGGDVTTAYVPPASEANWTMLLAGLVGLALGYAVLGTPSRIIARLFDRTRTSGLAPLTGSVLTLALRTGVALGLFVLLALPYVAMVAALLLLVLLAIGSPTGSRPGASEASPQDAPMVRPSSILIADLINDLWAGLPGLLAIALVAQHDWRLILAGVMLAVPVSLKSIMAARRSLRHSPIVLGAVAAVLAALVGFIALVDPQSGLWSLAGPWLSGLMIVVIAAAVLALNLKKPLTIRS